MMTESSQKSRAVLDVVLLTVAISAAYLWLQLPLLQPYSLQGFSLAILIFFGLKTLAKYRRQLLPDIAAFELVPLVFALLILVGSTGAGQSSYFALLYIFLLLLVLTVNLYGAIIITSELALVLYALSALLDPNDWRQLLSLPLMLGFFLYIKHQLQVSNLQREQLASSANTLEVVSHQKMSLEHFVGEFLKPKLKALVGLGHDPQTTKQLLLSQLDLLENEIDKVLSRNQPENTVPPIESKSSPSEPA